MTLALRILIVGGYGTFGGRLVELLEDDARLTLLIAGRSIARAREFCASRALSRVAGPAARRVCRVSRGVAVSAIGTLPLIRARPGGDTCATRFDPHLSSHRFN